MAPLDGSERARLRFEPEGAEVRVPSGTPVFDAASWNGIAIDSTCGGHGTCKKCKVRVLEGDVPVSAVDPRAFNADELRDGWRLACRAPARGELVIEVPPLQTRPKAALVGVGRHVILRPSIQKRHLVLEEPTMEDQRSDFERLQDALEDLEPRAGLAVLRTLGRVLRSANWDVTAVVADEELIDVEPGDTTARRFAIAFDLGTTTVVATLLDLETGTPAAVQSMLNRQQPFGADVITRISATMMDDAALDSLQARAQETMAQLTEEVCAEARVDPGEVYEITLCGNVTMTQLALGHRPRAALDGAVRRDDARAAAADGVGLRRAGAPARARVRVPFAGRLRRRRHRRGDARDGPDARQAAAAVHRRRHELRDRAGQPGRGRRDSGARRARRSRRRRSAAGCAPPTARSRASRSSTASLSLEVIGDVAPVGMCGSGLVDCVAELVSAGLLDHSGRYVDDETAASIAPAAGRPADVSSARSACSSCTGAARTRPTPCSCRSATCASCSSRRRRSRPAGTSCSGSSARSRRTCRRCCWPARSAPTCRRLPRSGSGSCRGWRCRGSCRPGNVAGEGAKIAALSHRERAEAHAIVREVRYVELSGRTDFNDRFIDQLAFPG